MTLTDNFRPENIPVEVQRFRDDRELPQFESSALTHPLSGGQSQIYRLRFSNDSQWAVRIPIHVTPSATEETVVFGLETEIKILKDLEKCSFPWSPRVIGYDLTFSNTVGYPFLVLNWISGQPLTWTATTPTKRTDRDRVLSQIANIMISLISCTRGDSFKPLDFFTLRIDQKITRICQGRLPELQIKDCFQLKRVLPRVLYPELETAPSFIEHGDLSAANIIVDSDYNVKGIIDWGFSNYRPFQSAAGLPRFLAAEDTACLELYIALQKDRASLLKALEQELPNYPTIVTPLLHLWSAPDVDYRRLVLEAVFSKGRHKWFADTPSLYSDCEDPADLELEVSEFLTRECGRISGLQATDLLRRLELENASM